MCRTRLPSGTPVVVERSGVLAVTMEQQESQSVIRLAGEFTLTSAAELKNLLLQGLAGFLRTAYRHTLPSWASSPSLVAHEHSQASRWEASHGSGGGPAPTSHHRPAIQQPAERRNRAVFDTPTRYKREGLRTT